VPKGRKKKERNKMDSRLEKVAFEAILKIKVG
jgi:hypothetical protein